MEHDSWQGRGPGSEIDPNIWSSLDKYLAGEVADDERARIETWLESQPDGEAIISALRRAGDGASANGGTWDVEQSWMQSRYRLQTDASAGDASSPLPLVVRTRWWRGGALATGVVAASLVVMLTAHRYISWGAGERTFATAPAQLLRVTLEDGTRVVLGPASRLKVAQRGRSVDLDGEAYFAVTHDERHPFTVHAGALVARDIGTAFDVRSYAGDQRPRVVVTDGEVSVRKSACQDATCIADLRMGDMADLMSVGLVIHRSVDTGKPLAWLQGGLSFQDTPLRTVVQDIGRTYGVSITIVDSVLAAKPVTGTFVNKPLKVIMDIVSEVVGAQYERNGQSIVVRVAPPTHTDSSHRSVPSPLITARANATNE